MKKIFLFFALFYSLNSTAQSLVDSTQLHQINSLHDINLTGTIAFNNYGHGYMFSLDSNMTYEKFSISDSYDFLIDSGTWNIDSGKYLMLVSKNESSKYIALQFGKYIFFISPKKKKGFLKDFETLSLKYTSFNYKEKQKRIWWILGKKYYFKISK